jgi:hypothetical protein
MVGCFVKVIMLSLILSFCDAFRSNFLPSLSRVTWRAGAVHHSSETIGTIAAALAKAQAELTNPEKSLIATTQPASSRETAASG